LAEKKVLKDGQNLYLIQFAKDLKDLKGMVSVYIIFIYMSMDD